MRFTSICAMSLASLLVLSSVQADPMLQPASVSTTLANFPGAVPANMINQSGMAATYTSGVTNFDTYVPATSTSAGGGSANTFYSMNAVTGNLDFNLGGSFQIQSLALWTDPQQINQSVKNFNLVAASDASFTTPIALGSFVALDGVAEPNNFGQIFSFTPTTASFVRLEIVSNYGSTLTTAISEAAFETIPEPTTLGALALFTVGLLRRARR